MIPVRPKRAITIVVATILAIPAFGGGALASETGTSPASGPKPTKGKVIANRLAVRTVFTPAAKQVGTLRKNDQITIYCKTKGVPVDGNPRWYLVNPDGRHYASARYIANVGPAPEWCPGKPQTAKVVGKPGVTIRTEPTTASRSVGRIAYGKVVPIVCKVDGPPVDGNPRWYQLYDGHWISARYAQNIDGVPTACR